MKISVKHSWLISMMIFMLFHGQTKAQHTPETDKAALIALYNTTEGIDWLRSDNWLDNTVPLEDWYGVTTDQNGRVSGLNLHANNLTGTIPTQIGDLDELLQLRLTRNKLSGEIPTTIGNLVKLVTLSLDQNKLTGSIPTQIGLMINLESLSLAINDLTGHIPQDISLLTKLVYLSFGDNDLTGPLPNNFGQLTTLTNLNLARNQLDGSITSLGGLTNLTGININQNKFIGSAAPLMNLTELISLYASGNEFDGSIPTAIGNLSKLQFLHLGFNKFTGAIPSEIGTLIQLRQISLGYNDFTPAPIPTALLQLTELTYIDLRKANLIESIPVGITALTKLELLSLHFNNLDDGLEHLTSMPNLKTIAIIRNPFTVLPDFANTPSLTHIYAGRNEFDFNDILPNTVIGLDLFSYRPQANIPISFNSGILSVDAGGNLHQWYKGSELVVTTTNPNYTPTEDGTYYVDVTHSGAPDLTLRSENIEVIVPDDILWIEDGVVAPNGNPTKYGKTVDIYGDYAVVGAANTSSGGGSAYIYHYDGQWNQVAVFNALNPHSFDSFGFSVAMHGDKVIVGAPGIGSVYVYERPLSGWHDNVQPTVITTDSNDIFFGSSVAIHNNNILAGAAYHSSANTTDSGIATLFEYNAPNDWEEITKFQLYDTNPNNDLFASSVAIGTDIIAIGAPSTGQNQVDPYGSVYIYKEVNNVWAQVERLRPDTFQPDARFGTSISITENSLHPRIAIGAPKDTDGSTYLYGAAYVFTRLTPSSNWVSYTKATNPSSNNRNFGYHVDIEAENMIVGMTPEFSGGGGGRITTTELGVAYIYHTIGNNSIGQKLTISDLPSEDVTATAVALSSNLKAIVGVPNKAYFYTTSVATNALRVEEVNEELENNLKDEFQVYPNPITLGAKLHLQFPKSDGQTTQIAIYDQLGKLVKRLQTDQVSMTISTQDFRKGLYILKYQTGVHSGSKKFIISE